MKFLSSEVVLSYYKSTIRPCIEYCCHIWTYANDCYLDMLDQTLKWVWRNVGQTYTASLEPLVCRRYVASLWKLSKTLHHFQQLPLQVKITEGFKGFIKRKNTTTIYESFIVHYISPITITLLQRSLSFRKYFFVLSVVQGVPLLLNVTNGIKYKKNIV